MGNVPWNNLNAGVQGVVLYDPATGEMYAAGGGSGSATAANQATQITAEQAIQAAVEGVLDVNIDSVTFVAAVVKGYQQITSLSGATALTVPSGSKYALIQCESQAVRWRDDGTNPTTSVGMRLLTTGELYYDGDLAALKFIEETTSAKLNVSYYS